MVSSGITPRAQRKAAVLAFIAEHGGVPYYEEAKPGKWVCPCCGDWKITRNADRPCEECRSAQVGVP